MLWVKGFVPFLADVFRHWVGKMTGFLSIVLGVVPVVFPDFFNGNHGVIHNRWLWWIVAAISFFIASRTAWDEQRKKVREAEKLLEEAINKDRPEVFATLSFGPGRVGTGSIGLQNHGVRDARNVQILSLRLNGLYRDDRGAREETKELSFPHFSCLPRKEHADYPSLTINNIHAIEKEGEFAFFLSTWCDRWKKSGLDFDVDVHWFDSFGNEFKSNSKVSYSRPDHKCRTVTGFVQTLRPPLQK